MEKRNEWLEDAIIAYLNNNPGVDSVDIVSHFKLRCDITLTSVKDLENNGKIQKKQSRWVNQYYVSNECIGTGSKSRALVRM